MEFCEGHQDMININNFLGRFETELNKTIFLERFYITCHNMIIDKSIWQEYFYDLFRDYDLNEATNEITTENFMQMLTDLNIIDADGAEKKYFEDEYNLEDAETV